jgi:hypothetical protein
MRKLLTLFVLVLCTSVQAQVKEGYIKYKMELTGGPGGDMGSFGQCFYDHLFQK